MVVKVSAQSSKHIDTITRLEFMRYATGTGAVLIVTPGIWHCPIESSELADRGVYGMKLFQNLIWILYSTLMKFLLIEEKIGVRGDLF